MAKERVNERGEIETSHPYSQSGQKTAENLARVFGPEMDWASELGSQGAGTTAANVAKVENLATTNAQAKQEDKK